MPLLDRGKEREKAKDFWKSLDSAARFQLGDDLVLGCFSFREWGFEHKPSSAFLHEVDYQRMLWESEEPA